MSITLTDIHQPVTLAEIDAELDAFNDRLLDYGYEAIVRFSPWGERVIEVILPTGASTEFYDDLPGFTAYRIATEQLIIETEGANA